MKKRYLCLFVFFLCAASFAAMGFISRKGSRLPRDYTTLGRPGQRYLVTIHPANDKAAGSQAKNLIYPWQTLPDCQT